MGAKNRITTCTLFLLVLLTLCLPLHADYHYASHEGSNEYPYTSWETAADSIQDAVDVASPHDTVYIGAGEYYESIVVDCDSIAIIGMGWDSTMVWYDVEDTNVIKMVHNRFYTWYVEGIRFEHLGSYICIQGGNRNNLHVNQCWFANPTNPGSSVGIGAAAAPDFTLIENCVFDSLSKGMFDILGSRRTEVRNCIFTNFSDDAITYDNHYGVIKNNIIVHGGWYYPIFGDTDTLLAVNNLIYGHSESFNVSALDTASVFNNTLDHLNLFPDMTAIKVGSHKTIINNSISNVGRVTYVQPNSIARIAYNNFWNITNEFYGEGDIDSTGGNLRANPMYIGDEDYHLQAFSPLIDAGNPEWLDVDGTRSDIGVYGGPRGEYYEYFDLPPSVPDSLSGEVIEESIVINWRYNTEADFSHYLLYRDTVSGFEPSVFNLVADPDTSYYIDHDIEEEYNYYYRIASADNQENISEYSEELEVIQTGIYDSFGAELPTITAIQSNYPNPFNSTTTIIYSVANLGPIPAQINISIYDIQGRKVKSLVNERKEVGEHNITWDGKDDSGNDCASGVYFARITQWHSEYLRKYQKLVLIR